MDLSQSSVSQCHAISQISWSEFCPLLNKFYMPLQTQFTSYAHAHLTDNSNLFKFSTCFILRPCGTFHRAMHFSAKRGLVITCPSVRLSVPLSVCDVSGLWSHTGWAKKNEATVRFAEYPAMHFPKYLKLQKIIIRFFANIEASIYILYSKHAYNIRVHRFYCLKWHHLVNHSPLDNTTLKLQHHSVGRHLVHKKVERCVCGTRGQGQWSILVMRRFLIKITAPVQDAAITSGRCSNMARQLVC